MLRLVDAAEPHVRGDARLVRQAHECRRVLAEDIRDGTVLLRHRHDTDPRREMRTDALLNEPRATNAVRKSLHRDRPVSLTASGSLRYFFSVGFWPSALSIRWSASSYRDNSLGSKIVASLQ